MRGPSLSGMRSLPEISDQQFGVFTVEQAIADGWTRSALRHAVRTDGLYVLRRGLLAAPPEAMDPWQQRLILHRHAAAAAGLAYPQALVSHASAALLHGLPLLFVPDRPCLTAAHDHAGSVPAVHLHRSRVAPRERLRLGPVRACSPARAAVDIAREAGVAAGLVVADAALAVGLAGVNDLLLGAARSTRRPRVGAARFVAEFADGLAESPLESVSRLRIAEVGLPAPLLQREIWIDGQFVRRVDFYWDDLGVAGEADGWEKYRTDFRALEREKTKQELLESAGLPVIRWSAADTREFAAVERRIRSAARRALPPGARIWEVRPPRPWLRPAG